MCATRVFYNVGQALFSMEHRADDVTIVYDCGGQTANKVKTVIDRSWPHDGDIDALFISHYDRDHINGVQHLLQRYNVRHLFLPMVSPLQKILAAVDCKKGTFEFNFCFNPEGTIRSMSKGRNEEVNIHFVQYSNGEEYKGDIMDIEHCGKNVPSGGTFNIKGNRDWIYRVFNLEYMTQPEWESFVSAMNLPKDTTEADILKVWEQNRLRIRAALIEAGCVSNNTINAYSMTLYSGPRSHKGGCLYTGDYDARKNMVQLKNAYADVWSNICVLQIPHHGSDYNFNKQLIKADSIHVVSAKAPRYSKSDVNPYAVRNTIVNMARYAETLYGDVVVPCCMYAPYWFRHHCWC